MTFDHMSLQEPIIGKGKTALRQTAYCVWSRTSLKKNRTLECYRKNLVYEMNCLTCELADLTEEEKGDFKKKMRTYKCFGESSIRTFERDCEHLNNMAQLKSGMFKHVLGVHHNQDISEINFGMRVLKYCHLWTTNNRSWGIWFFYISIFNVFHYGFW